ncbi:MAG: YifB family Mg chelatase-like AAA ATPase [Candidatus Nanopelagicales bacterium]
MKLARTTGVVVLGVEGHLVEIEAHVGQGLPGMTIVGLPDTAVGEARDRARTAVLSSGAEWPGTRITVGLSPAALHKRGSGLDLGIAVAVLAATGQVPAAAAERCVMVGELGLDGRVRPVRGAVVAAVAAHRAGRDRLVVPAGNLAEAGLVPGVEVVGVRTLRHLCAVLRGEAVGAALGESDDGPGPDRGGAADPGRGDDPELADGRGPDLADVRGQGAARRALEIAAAGGHHLSLAGPPGVGKTLLAERLPGLLPDLDDAAALEVTALRSVAGRLDPGAGLVRRPPFEAPHHTASPVALIGGGSGSAIRAGLVSLAHRGVLFLDEAPEFDRAVLEALRQPLESGTITVARSGHVVRFPARFQLVLAANPCPCGARSERGDDCSCTAMARRRYAAKLSGPLLDRIDLRVVVRRPGPVDLDADRQPEGSAAVRDRVCAARERAVRRLVGTPWRTNAEVPARALRTRWTPEPTAHRVLERALARGTLSLRGADRALRVAWTLADLAGRGRPGPDDVATALGLRGPDASGAAA